jgi:hypothetical protein
LDEISVDNGSCSGFFGELERSEFKRGKGQDFIVALVARLE